VDVEDQLPDCAEVIAAALADCGVKQNAVNKITALNIKILRALFTLSLSRILN
jgi:carbamoylphosphate synthase small subunit